MPFTAPIQQATTTAQAVINSASAEMRSVLDATVANDQTLLLDWTNRAQLILLRASRWDFLQSLPQYFITAREQTDYWVGPAGQAPNGTVDTLLNISNLDVIKRNSVYDVTNSVQLQKTDALPFSQTLSKNDALFRPGKPANWRQDLFNPGIMNLYPAPDNQNTWQPVPQTPFVTFVPGGSLPMRTYLVTTSFVDSLGFEGSVADREAVVTIPAGFLAVVNSPSLPLNVTTYGVSYDLYNVYAATIPSPIVAPALGNTETLQTSSPIAYGLNWTEPTSGLTTTGRGIIPAANVEITPMDGYLISFRYYAQRDIIENVSDVLQIPDVYFDIIVAGVCMYAAQYLRLAGEQIQYWGQQFTDGVRQMIKDRNLIPREADYVGPDASGVGIGVQTPYEDIFNYMSRG